MSNAPHSLSGPGPEIPPLAPLRQLLFGKYRAVVVAVILFVLLDLTVLLLNAYISYQISEDTVSINIAARQRMLTQRMTKALVNLEVETMRGADADAEVDRDELAAAARLFDETLTGLKSGGTVTGTQGNAVVLKAVDGAGGQAILAETEALWLPFKQALAPITAGAYTPAQLSAAVQHAHEHNLQLLDAANRMATELEASAERGSQSLRQIQLAGLWLALLNFFFIVFKFIGNMQQGDMRIDEGREKLRIIVDTALDAVVQMDANGLITGWNRQAEAIFGWSKAEAMGRPLDQTIIPPHQREAHRTGLARFLESGEPRVINRRIEVVGQHRNGNSFPVELAISPIRMGNHYEFSGFIRDISERKRAETALRELNQNLELRIRERTRELAAAKEQAEDATVAKSRFLANMSHEIRTPMSAVIGMAHLALKTELGPKQRDYVEKIRASGEHLLRLLDDILDISKIEAGKLTLETVDFELTEVLTHVTDLMGERIAAKGLKLQVDLDQGLAGSLSGDPLRLGQVLINFLSNAIKFTAQGGIVLRIRQVSGSDGDALVRFEVQDSGIGIRDDQVGRLFGAFQQADTSTSREFGGTGLGLAISKQLATMMGGEVGVSSKLGQGSTFWFTAHLGRGAMTGAGAGNAAPEARLPLLGTHILLAEDNLVNQQIAAEMLEQAGAIVAVAGNGQEAIDTLLHGRFDCVLMDVQMPKVDGFEATRRIRAERRLAGIPVIAITANASMEDRDHCLSAGMNDFVTKPIKPEILYATIAKWLPTHAPGDRARVAAAPGRGALEAVPAAAVAAQDPDIIDLRILAATVRNDAAKVERFASLFIESAGNAVVAMEEALQRGDMAALARLGHREKSGASMVGAMRFSDLCRQLEQCKDEADIDSARARIAELRALVEPIALAVAAHLGNVPRAAKVSEAERSFPAEAAAPRDEPASQKKTLLLVDDEPMNLGLIEDVLRQDFNTKIATSGELALALVRSPPLPDLVLLDIEMPDMDGYEVCTRLREDPATSDIPVIFLSGHDSPKEIAHGFELGAVDYVSKPVIPAVLLARVQTHLRLRETRALLTSQNQHLERMVADRTDALQRRTDEVLRIQELSIVALGALAETRDNETGNHIYRTQAYVKALIERLVGSGRLREPLSEHDLEQIWKSAPLHDIGKVGIPDGILLKPGKLTAEEFEIMKLHTVLGREALASAERRVSMEESFLRTAGDIAHFHHERWDGRGYPLGLAGEAIPLSARLMAVADVYDALISARVYKPAIPHAESVQIIRGGRGSQFDPDIVDCFVDIAAEFGIIAARFHDEANVDATQGKSAPN